MKNMRIFGLLALISIMLGFVIGTESQIVKGVVEAVENEMAVNNEMPLEQSTPSE